jgi:glycosyltransferase involved in cell wall biosynthesis
MRIAFYAPMKPPTHGTPSGDRRVAGLYMEALARAGHRVELTSTFRSYDGAGDGARQAALREQGVALGRSLAAQWRAAAPGNRPDLWFTYHVYHKAPDWLGPEASAALGIPYVIAEASHAGKRARGPWALGHEGAENAIRRAQLLLCPTRDDVAGLLPLASDPARVVWLPPFIDVAPFAAARAQRGAHRAQLAAAHGLDPQVAWISIAAMMRPGDKLESYRSLAAALARLADLPWRLLVAGDGAASAEVRAAFETAVPGRAVFLGMLQLPEVAALCAASDLCAWPAVNEAYGMALLEAAAAGVPAVSCSVRGVPDVVRDGHTGLLAAAQDEAGLAERLRSLITDPARREALGRAAAEFAAGERSIQAAAARLDQLLPKSA